MNELEMRIEKQIAFCKGEIANRQFFNTIVWEVQLSGWQALRAVLAIPKHSLEISFLRKRPQVC